MQRRTVLIVIIAVVALIVLLLAGPGATFYTDLLWYKDVGYTQTFGTRLWTQTFAFLVAGTGFALIAGLNIWIARRLSPLRPLAITNDILFNLRRSVDPVIRWLIVGIVIAAAVAFAATTLSEWEEIVLFFNRQAFGVKDPVFGNDISFYVFSLPLWKFVLDWSFGALAVTICMVAAVYAYAGAIGPQPEGGYLAPQPRNHIAVLLGIVLLLKAAAYQINQWELLYSPTGGQVQGASYTDVNAYLPAYRVLFFIAIGAALLLFATFLTKRLVLPIVAIALMALSALIIGGIYPRIVQQFKVSPSELSFETPFIERSINFTRQAYGLTNVQVANFRPSIEKPSTQELQANDTTLRNVRIWDDTPLLRNLQNQQRLGAPYYKFNSVAVDRYPIEEKKTQVLVSAREVSTSALSERNRTWQNEHLVYTHGFAPVVAQTNASEKSGAPEYLVDNIPPTNPKSAVSLDIKQPRIYFGEQTDNFIFVNTKLEELDRPRNLDPDTASANAGTAKTTTTTTAPHAGETLGEAQGTPADEVTYVYKGKSGIQIDSLWKRLAFSLRMQDIKVLLSSDITDKSRLLFDRQVSDRVRRIAPFLTLDETPYMAIIGGRLVWILDAYTTSSLYPYSEQSDLPSFSGQNYIRNSVKVTVDAYAGDISLYRIDNTDPIAAAWAAAMPGMFKSSKDIPNEVRTHFRYPQDLFGAQLRMYRTYHMTDPAEFYQKADAWQVAQQALGREPTQVTTTTPKQAQDTSTVATTSEVPLSQYLMFALPGNDQAELLLTNSYTPASQEGQENPNLISIMAARSDPEHYGELVSLQLPRDRQINGPRQIESLVNSNEDLSATKTLLGKSGSEVIEGQVRIIPVAGTLLYVQPWFVTGEAAALPRLNKVILVFNQEVAFGDTFSEALVKMLGVTPLDEKSREPQVPSPKPGEPQPQPQQETTSAEVGPLVAKASSVYNDMQAALARGDLAEYGRLEKELGKILNQLQEQAQQLQPTRP